MPKLYLIAGHTQDKGEGAQNLKTGETENDITTQLLLRVFARIKKHVFTDLCPFDLTLAQKTAWINKRASDDDFVVSCHLNSSPQRKEKGAMCFFYGGSESSKRKSKRFLDKYCEVIGLENDGVVADTKSRFGRLGIVRDTKGWAFLLEMGSINNDLDVVKEKGEEALYQALLALLKIEVKEEEPKEEKPFDDVDKNHPYFEDIKWAKEKGIAEGYEKKVLGVDDNLTVGRFLAFLKKYDNISR